MMDALCTITDSWMWYLMCSVSLIQLVGAITILFRTVFDTHKIRPLIFAGANVLLSFLVFFVFMDCSRVVSGSREHCFMPFQLMMSELPSVFWAGVEVLSGILLLICSRDNMKYRTTNLTSDTVIETVNLLPEGIAVSSPEGTVRLSNLRMNKLSKKLTGEILFDANLFWSHIEEAGKEQGGKYLIRTHDKEVWFFGKDSFEIGGTQYEQITATDVTERYRIIDELEAKNERLQDIQRRMKAVTELSGDMFVAQEEADARAALHNQLGQVLLMGRHYINHKDSTDPKVVYMATRQMNLFLLGESEEPYRGEDDALTMAVSMANSIGVRIDMTGTAPKDPDVRKILARAITECAANTVKHAEGDRVKVDLRDDEGKTFIAITNNGRPPKGAITESGGLLSLRRNVEEAGGEMTVEFSPEFLLTIKLDDLKDSTAES